MITTNLIIEIGLYATLSVLILTLFVIFRVIKSVLREYVQIRGQIGAFLNENPDDIGKYLKPYLDAIIRQYNINPGAMQGGGMITKPIKITGNSGIDGLIAMFIQSKVMGATNSQPKPATEETTKNPF